MLILIWRNVASCEAFNFDIAHCSLYKSHSSPVFRFSVNGTV